MRSDVICAQVKQSMKTLLCELANTCRYRKNVHMRILEMGLWNDCLLEDIKNVIICLFAHLLNKQ